MIQLIGAPYSTHTHHAILDASMNIKVGDLGLTVRIKSLGERKKTICGTPNYVVRQRYCLTQMDTTISEFFDALTGICN
jgi:hypothetical protein